MLRILLSSMAVILCLSVSAQTELSMGTQFGAENIDEITEWAQEGFTITPSKGENAKDKVPCYKTKNKEVRMYALNTLTIKAPEGVSITDIVFTLSKQGIEEQAIITASTGEVQPQEVGAKNVSWSGDDDKIIFTVGETNSLHPEGITDGSGQLDFTAITITTKNASTGIEEVTAIDDPDASTVYYDLSGKEVAIPSIGIYIRRQGNKVSKIQVR